jgi:hypothetical protein
MVPRRVQGRAPGLLLKNELFVGRAALVHFAQQRMCAPAFCVDQEFLSHPACLSLRL